MLGIESHGATGTAQLKLMNRWLDTFSLHQLVRCIDAKSRGQKCRESR